ncbi:hypothetical protein G5I_06069 [Acromyrmex echinatior]|uniref:BED-type domain-containing protein n=2 Tax=Acromyrmex echinatior TaxID=103372 RepID=F4WK26_ACREC|nr:hypothetical protein G5I_06069 [Acromyrmex echinatior]
MHHPEVLTEEQKTEHNIHWAWDYFTLTSDGDAKCNMCKKIFPAYDAHRLGIHLKVHRKKNKIFDPDEVIYEDTYRYGTSASASGSMIVEDAEYQEASIPMASNLTDDTDRICVPNESATKTSETSEYVASPLENIDITIDNIKLPAELKPLSDTEEVADREELSSFGEEYLI